jgi:hypothetical protein
MAVIKLKSDDLDLEIGRFTPLPLPQPLFVNSLRKSGSHMLANILRMFVPIEQLYRGHYIQLDNFKDHLRAWDRSARLMSVGHLFFTPRSAAALAGVRTLLLYRDPYSWVISQARFFLADQFQGGIPTLKHPQMSTDDLLTLMIFGIRQKLRPMRNIYLHNVVQWLGQPNVYAVRYEDLVRHRDAITTGEAEAYFRDLLGACGIDPIPDDWAERIRTGGDPSRSGTARENLTGISKTLPDELPEKHRRLIEYAAPGLRNLLGYE